MGIAWAVLAPAIPAAEIALAPAEHGGVLPAPRAAAWLTLPAAADPRPAALPVDPAARLEAKLGALRVASPAAERITLGAEACVIDTAQADPAGDGTKEGPADVGNCDGAAQDAAPRRVVQAAAPKDAALADAE
mmetsp:Transcript_9864/g.28270  ORF Transcript_9864/g.28270 Transcript_9864/m.28270 type:complete len:134 (-) Transcript_9864:579-980(-)